MVLKKLTNEENQLYSSDLAISLVPTVRSGELFDSEHLKQLDASWEKAQLELDYDTLDALLAEDFIWVHNHANTIDDKKRFGTYQ